MALSPPKCAGTTSSSKSKMIHACHSVGSTTKPQTTSSRETNLVVADPEATADQELEQLIHWCQSRLSSLPMREKVDIPTVVELLATLDAPYEVSHVALPSRMRSLPHVFFVIQSFWGFPNLLYRTYMVRFFIWRPSFLYDSLTSFILLLVACDYSLLLVLISSSVVSPHASPLLLLPFHSHRQSMLLCSRVFVTQTVVVHNATFVGNIDHRITFPLCAYGFFNENTHAVGT